MKERNFKTLGLVLFYSYCGGSMTTDFDSCTVVIILYVHLFSYYNSIKFNTSI